MILVKSELHDDNGGGLELFFALTLRRVRRRKGGIIWKYIDWKYLLGIDLHNILRMENWRSASTIYTSVVRTRLQSNNFENVFGRTCGYFRSYETVVSVGRQPKCSKLWDKLSTRNLCCVILKTGISPPNNLCKVLRAKYIFMFQ